MVESHAVDIVTVVVVYIVHMRCLNDCDRLLLLSSAAQLVTMHPRMVFANFLMRIEVTGGDS